MFKEGDRVYYTSGRHRTGKANPLRGSSVECQGTVEGQLGGSLRVLWDNGSYNTYDESDLVHVGDSKLNPNFAFRLKRRRSRHGYK